MSVRLKQALHWRIFGNRWAVGVRAVDMAVAATPGATHAVFHTRAAERQAHLVLKERAGALGLQVVEPG